MTTPNEIPTPETDVHAFHRISGISSPDGDVVGVKFARQLEREVIQLTAQVEKLSSANDELFKIKQKTVVENVRLRTALAAIQRSEQ